MNVSKFYKKLTSAEVGSTKTHEIYIRMSNDFDYETFFSGTHVQNQSVIEVNFSVHIQSRKNISLPASERELRFVYFANSNKEKRIPGLGNLFKDYEVEEGDVVCLERNSTNGVPTYTLTFFGPNQIQVSPACFTITQDIPESVSVQPLKALPFEVPLQQIFYGAPGSGKSHTIEQMCSTYENYRTTFHPDTDYASFVGSYKPITIKTDVRDMAGHIVYEKGEAVKESRIVYRYVMQAFLKAYVAAWREQQNDDPKPVFLIVEEINRGNCAQIFGDIFQLLDRNAAGFSDYPIIADDDLAQELKEMLGEFCIAKHDAINALYSGGKDVVGMVKKGEGLLLPNNMYIWATMNTSDQSLFPIDSAFKRRWDWNYIKIKDAGENFKIVFSNGNSYDWWNFVSAINERIEGGEIQQEDKKLGYFFAKTKNKVISPKVLLSKVLFYLYNDVFKDFGLDEDFFKDENGETMSFASYFDNNGQINENRVERFVTNLCLEPEFKDYTEEVDELTVNGKKMRYITDAVFEILSEAAKSNTSEAIVDAVDDIFADRDDVVKSIDNPESYEKENRWNKTPIIANDGTAFVVSNQWHKNEIQQVKELAGHFNIPFDYALGESDNVDDASEQNDGRDYTKYMINGQGRYSKKMLAYELVKLYIEQHPEMSAFEVVKEWSSLGNIVSHFVELKEAYDSRKGTDKANRVAVVECKGEPIYVSTNGWGGKSKIQELIDALQSKGWNMSVNEIG